MRKIPTLFERNDEDRRYVTELVTPGCEWVLRGEGQATRKYDGTCILVDDSGQAWARREVKAGATPPPNFALVEHDATTGKDFGWEPADQSGFAKFIAEAMHDGLDGGTYELIGPKIQGNPEGAPAHQLVRHEHAEHVDVPLTFSGLRDWLQRSTFEGIVWHHPDGRMAKLKRRDFPRAT